MAKADIGLWGLAVMGKNLVLNMESKGFTVAVYNRTVEKVKDFAVNKAKGKNIIPAYNLEDFIGSIDRPRKVMIMVKAGKPVDNVIEQIIPLLDKGDLIIDGGNSHFADTIRRCRTLRQKGFFFIGTGISGGEEGALKGPSIMPGGSKDAYKLVKPIFTKISAQVDGMPCCTYIGDNGAGHFVKMVHNGIEYADMQLISEAYCLMKNLLGMNCQKMHETFHKWNAGNLNSYLIEITGDILSKKDPETGNYLVEMILDEADQKGTGTWTIENAVELGVAVPTIAQAVFARFISASKEQRIQTAKQINAADNEYSDRQEDFINALADGLYASRICAYAQGFAIMDSAAKRYQWDLELPQISMIWQGGCIIRAKLLHKIKEAFERNPNLQNLLLDSLLKQTIEKTQDNWRNVAIAATQHGIAIPAISSALNYFDSFRSNPSGANIIQAQRDYFGGHTYKRIDRQGVFHTEWKNLK